MTQQLQDMSGRFFFCLLKILKKKDTSGCRPIVFRRKRYGRDVMFSACTQVPPVVRAVHQTELREGVHEVRHAHGSGTTPVLGDVGDDKDPQAGLPGAHEVQRVRGPVPRVGAQTQTSAERHAEQV